MNWLWHRHEPKYDGVRLSIWLDELSTPIGTPRDQRAIYVLQKLGPEAVPWMLRSIRRTPSRYDLWYSRFWSKLPSSVQSLAHQPKWVRQGMTAYAFQHLGNRALPVLIDAYAPNTPSHVRYAIETGVSGICANAKHAAAPLLLPFLSDPRPDIRAVTASFLGQIGTNLDTQASTVCAALRTKLNDPLPRVRDEAAMALWRIDQDTNAVSFLVGELESKPDEQRHLQLINFFRGIKEDPRGSSQVSNVVRRSRRLQALFEPSPFE